MICCHKSKYLVDGAWFANSYLLPHTAAVFTLLLFAASWFIVNKFTLVDANCCIVYEFVLLPNAIKHILCEFKLNCDTRCGFLVGIHIYIFFFCCTLMHKCKILPHACVLFAHSRFLLHADAWLCMFCKFTFVCKRYPRLLAIIIYSQTMHRALNFLLVAARCCGICQFILVAASWLIVIHTF